MGLKSFTKNNYHTISEALSDIKKEFKLLWSAVDNISPEEGGGMSEPNSYMPEPISEGGGSEYNGFFKITYSENRIKIANALICYVNNIKTTVDGGEDFLPTNASDEYDYQMGVSDGWLQNDHSICLKFTGVSYSSGSDLSVRLAVIEGKELPDSTDEEVWYMLATVASGGVVTQIHTSGYPRLLWLYRCVNE